MDKNLIIEILVGFGISLGGWLANRLLIFLKTNRISLLSHRLFADLLDSMHEISLWRVPEHREVLRIMLQIKLRCWYDQAKLFAEKLDKEVWSYNKEKLKLVFKEWTILTIEAYNQKWKDEDIPIQLITLINEIHEKKVAKFISFIDEAMLNNFYITNKLRVSAIFDILDTLLAEAKNEFLDYIFMREFNGRLKSATYKGKPINPIEND